MRNTVIKVLNRAHGKKVVQYFKSLGINTRGLEGNATEEDDHTNIFYGVNDNDYFDNMSQREVREGGFTIIELPSTQDTRTTTTVELENTSINTKEIIMNLVKTKEVTLNETKREITIVVVVENGVVKSGYSVKLPEDKENAELAEKIATGRASKEKTNLTPDTELGKGLDKKYILHAIADNLFLKIERGVLKIKGVK